MKKLILMFAGILAVAGLFVSCGFSKNMGDLNLYYVLSDKTGIEAVPVELTATSTNEEIEELLSDLSDSTTDVEYMATIPTEVTVIDWELEKGGLTLYFTGPYYSMDIYTQVLVRAAIVKTLTQVEGIDSVAIYLEDQPLTDVDGNAIGSMTADMFIEDFGQETDSLLSKEITLYFASADGMSLVAENREVYYSRNVALEKLVIEELMDGPSTEGSLTAIPPGTKLISVSVTDGICYVNFDSGLETTISGITENATIYSIINSLTALESVKQVQILVAGETPHISNLDIDLSVPIAANKDMIQKNVTLTEPEEGIDTEVSDEIVVDVSSDEEENNN